MTQPLLFPAAAAGSLILLFSLHAGAEPMRSKPMIVPAGLAAGFVKVIYKPVRAERTERRIILPSFSVSGVKQTTEKAAPEVVRKDVRLMIRFVATMVETATEVARRREEADA